MRTKNDFLFIFDNEEDARAFTSSDDFEDRKKNWANTRVDGFWCSGDLNNQCTIIDNRKIIETAGVAEIWELYLDTVDEFDGTMYQQGKKDGLRMALALVGEQLVGTCNAVTTCNWRSDDGEFSSSCGIHEDTDMTKLRYCGNCGREIARS